ncbi:UDP-N-acetylglucosamine 1-carboxyvinyltransferase [Enterobacteriaceae endosymbiont of Plateumaris consimilis]|uniref:UDP-N-acetylglucosamine 1-carboxyvinyltransferase n=1 Tax=Enterobacteriaceae endosymbiont of Plateumaris consimilis TaxID=2675794 RepID=UPI00144A129B|nr:UDP-N-acetylglucosamine 1-carboxyvinyltransferase [Enterobacteriaceae endosymbiont of Plateumaris consimilis]QJC28848.1 UDP-N-acetylglucosamine 1-carboxyvinyltransferase [Enterobacteriaceae endosymbiont of Plateumaris consimilis]
MDKFIIKGPVKLKGKVIISGSKNAALPILFASLLIPDIVEIKNVPKLKDIDIAIKILIKLGVKVKREKSLIINASNIIKYNPPSYLIKSIRASIWILSPLLTRIGKVNISFPGGCSIGNRPIDLHINSLKTLGANIYVKKNYIKGYIKKKFKGSIIYMKNISVGATITIILAATLASNITIIKNAAKEPEIQDLANFLNIMGAHIQGAGTDKIIIEGVKKLKGGVYTIISDRIETGTFLIAAAICKSKILCENTNPNNLNIVLNKLKKTGAEIKKGKNWCSINMHGQRPKSVNIITGPYPNFPTDMQSQFALLNLISTGISTIKENIFKHRFMYVPELIRMGADITLKKNILKCKGIKLLFGSEVIATDLRASVSLVLAGCIASGTTIINNIYHIDRGYENIENKLSSLGANIKRIKY